MAFIEASGLTKTFASAAGTKEVLRGATLAIEHGEFVAIVGTMGCGKSTLLNLLAGLTTPDAGQVLVEGRPMDGVRRCRRP